MPTSVDSHLFNLSSNRFNPINRTKQTTNFTRIRYQFWKRGVFAQFESNYMGCCKMPNFPVNLGSVKQMLRNICLILWNRRKKQTEKKHCSSFFFHFAAACSIWIWCKRTVRCEFVAYEFHAWCLFCFIHIRACAFPFHLIFTWCTVTVTSQVVRALLEQFQSSRSFTDCMIFGIVAVIFIDQTDCVYECCTASHWASIQFTAHNSLLLWTFSLLYVCKRQGRKKVAWGGREWNDVTVY